MGVVLVSCGPGCRTVHETLMRQVATFGGPYGTVNVAVNVVVDPLGLVRTAVTTYDPGVLGTAYALAVVTDPPAKSHGAAPSVRTKVPLRLNRTDEPGAFAVRKM
jgi:hypothetical protein